MGSGRDSEFRDLYHPDVCPTVMSLLHTALRIAFKPADYPLLGRAGLTLDNLIQILPSVIPLLARAALGPLHRGAGRNRAEQID